MLLGFLAALAAAVCYDTGYALQALAVRRSGPRRMRLVAATALVGLGWPLQLAALSRAPLTLVQPTLALGLLLLLVLGAHVLGERVGAREIGAVLAIVGGVAAIAATAPERTDSHAAAAVLVPVLAALGLVAAAPPLFALGGFALIAAAGAGDAWAAFAAKLVVDELTGRRWLMAAAFAVGAGAAVALGFLSELKALRTQPATRVGPSVLALQIAIPVVLAPLVGGERWTNAPVVLVSLGVLTAGVVVLAASRSVLGVVEHD